MGDDRRPVMVCATDLGGTALETIQAALSLAAQCSCACLHVVHVRRHADRLKTAQEAADAIEHEEQRISEAVARADARSIPVIPQLRTGEPCHEILAAVRELHADYLVIGSHGHAGLDHFVSVAERVARRAPCNVVIVKPPSVSTRLSRDLDAWLDR